LGAASRLDWESPMVIADLVDEFSNTYKDAGRMIGIALGVFMKRDT
jgi:hypothetical protein